MTEPATLTLIENGSKDRKTVTATVAATGKSRRPPLFVPRDQLYYWSHEWQDGEAEALREIANGQTHTFSDGTSAAEWLLSDDEDDENA